MRTGEGGWGCGGVADAGKRMEQWRKSMLPMRSIELSIIQPQDADLQMRRRKRKRRRKCRGRCEGKGGLFVGAHGGGWTDGE